MEQIKEVDWQSHRELLQFFPATRTQSFSDEDFDRISEILEINGKSEWSKVPRTYAVLRLISAVDYLDKLVLQGVTDISIPYDSSNLPHSLPPELRPKFLEAQILVLTDILDLERGLSGRHLHFHSRTGLQFETLEFLGKGKCARVEKVKSKIGQRVYAMKLINRSSVFKRDQIAMANFLRELGVSKRVDHLHVVKVVGSFSERKYVGIIMDTVGDSDLETFFTRDMDAQNKSLLRAFFGCLVSGLMAIHNMQIRHKDIKPSNIIVKGSRVMYTDFGLALDYSQTDRSTTGGRPAMFSPQYCAPEVFDWKDRKSSSDIFSLGAVFLEMVTRLNDEQISSLRSFGNNTVNSDIERQISSFYCQNLSGIQSWLEYLDLKPGALENKIPLLWVSSMIREQENERPTAYELWEQLEESTAKEKAVFACSVCAASHDSAESIVSTPRLLPSVLGSMGLEDSESEISTLRDEDHPFTYVSVSNCPKPNSMTQLEVDTSTEGKGGKRSSSLYMDGTYSASFSAMSPTFSILESSYYPSPDLSPNEFQGFTGYDISHPTTPNTIISNYISPSSPGIDLDKKISVSNLVRDVTPRSHPLYHAAPSEGGYYYCPFTVTEHCGHEPKQLKYEYDKQIDSHLKPLRCDRFKCEDLCFSSTACLLRHKREAHGNGHQDESLCEYPPCNRSMPGNGFRYSYTCKDHMNRCHGWVD